MFLLAPLIVFQLFVQILSLPVLLLLHRIRRTLLLPLNVL